MKVSLILSTIGRVDSLNIFFDSILRQKNMPYEIIVIDQNDDNRLDDVIGEYSNHINIIHKKVNQKGLSRARNIGLSIATGDIVGFPDDDCWYKPDTIELVNRYFANQKVDCITGCPITDRGAKLVQNFYDYDSDVNNSNAWNAGISFTIFCRKYIASDIGGFDEQLGVGSGTKYGSGEETDFLLRILSHGYSVKYHRDLEVGHPDKDKTLDYCILKNRAFSYACGEGYVLKKNQISVGTIMYHLFRPFCGILISLAKGDFNLAKIRYYKLKGKIVGLYFN